MKTGGRRGVSVALALCIGLASGSGGCANNTENGALIGGLGGAALGAGIGSLSHARAGEGALIGGAIGALGGALIGNQVDKQQAKRDREEYTHFQEARQSQPSQYEQITKQDVIGWSARGTRDDIIIDRIERGKTVFHLTAADENELRDAGVSADVVRAMKNTARQ